MWPSLTRKKNCTYEVLKRRSLGVPLGSVATSFAVIPYPASPPWHRRQRQQRARARATVQQPQSVPQGALLAAIDCLSSHHGSTVPPSAYRALFAMAPYGRRDKWNCPGCGWYHPTSQQTCDFCFSAESHRRPSASVPQRNQQRQARPMSTVPRTFSNKPTYAQVANPNRRPPQQQRQPTSHPSTDRSGWIDYSKYSAQAWSSYPSNDEEPTEHTRHIMALLEQGKALRVKCKALRSLKQPCYQSEIDHLSSQISSVDNAITAENRQPKGSSS
jgi:hypothetical protein